MLIIFVITAVAIWVTAKEILYAIRVTLTTKSKWIRLAGIVTLIACAIMIAMIFIGH